MFDHYFFQIFLLFLVVQRIQPGRYLKVGLLRCTTQWSSGHYWLYSLVKSLTKSEAVVDLQMWGYSVLMVGKWDCRMMAEEEKRHFRTRFIFWTCLGIDYFSRSQNLEYFLDILKLCLFFGLTGTFFQIPELRMFFSNLEEL